MLQILMVIGFISSLFHQPASIGQLLLLLLLLLVMAVWKLVQCQYYTMGRPAQVRLCVRCAYSLPVQGIG